MITDFVVAAVLIYFFAKGWSRGFFKTLLGPISLALACILSLIYYQKSQNMMASLLIAAIGPFLITIIVSLCLKAWHKSTRDKPPILPISSRLLGSVFSLLWGSVYLVIMLILAGLFPVKIEKIKPIQDNIVSSKSYAFINQYAKNKIPGAEYDLEKIQTLLQDPEQIEQLQSTDEFKNLVEDERLVEIFSDETISEQIRNKNYTQLLSNPDIQAIFQNEELLKKMFALNKRIMEGVSEEETKSEPKIVEVE